MGSTPTARAVNAIRDIILTEEGTAFACAGECKRGSTTEHRVEWIEGSGRRRRGGVNAFILHDVKCLGTSKPPVIPELVDELKRTDAMREWLRAQPGASFFNERMMLDGFL